VAQGLVFGFALVRYRYHKMYRIYTDVSVTAKSGSTTFRRRVNEKCVGRRRQRGMDAKGSCGGARAEERVHQRSKNLVATKWNVFHSWKSRGGAGGDSSLLCYTPFNIYICHSPPPPQSFGHARKLLSLPQLDTETVPDCHSYPLDRYSGWLELVE